MKQSKKRVSKRRKVLRKEKRKVTAKIKPSSSTREEKAVLKTIHRVSINARRRAQNSNADITIIRNGEIIRISAKGEKKVIGKVKKTSVNVDTNKPIRIS